MITPTYCQTMARYNAWQNSGLIGMVDVMDEDALRLDRGAFFGSIFKTLNHLLWGDQLWISRFDGGEGPTCSVADNTVLTATPTVWATARAQTDTRIIQWADALQSNDLLGDVSWYSVTSHRDFIKNKAFCVVHMFNHQTHHRGQIHAMLTAAGQKPGDTDLPFMPED